MESELEEILNHYSLYNSNIFCFSLHNSNYYM